MLGQTVPNAGRSTGKARSPTVDSRVRRIFSDSEEADRRRLWASKSAVYSSSSARYDGAVPCKHLYTRTASLNWVLSQALWCSQPVQLAEERSDAVIPRRREHDCLPWWNALPVSVRGATSVNLFKRTLKTRSIHSTTLRKPICLA